ncbi:MAG: 3-methyl-2-oxobutanoate hydroxymethyltransferase [Deltaproteobacteria bacterium]|nr:3-methyl-2-oxobutanoate hydroxymethyltransferase [Deltaproteobacteria bacterium]
MAAITVQDIRRKKGAGEKIVMVTAYDFTMARLVDKAGVDMVLVGDSLGMVVQGHEDTLPVTLEEVIYHTRAVARGLTGPHLVADMPFMSYQLSPEQALANAGRLVKEGRAQSVKLEGGERTAPAVARIVEAGIPVVGHVGLTPQSVHAMGGFKVQGRSDAGAQAVMRGAKALEEAGAFCVVLEGIPADLAAAVTASLAVPTVGIGAGAGADGQVLVCTDLLGFDLSFTPRFLKRYAELETTIVGAFQTYAAEVRAGTFPGPEHAFQRRSPQEIKRLY